MSIRSTYAGFAYGGTIPGGQMTGFLLVNSPLDPTWRLARFVEVPTPEEAKVAIAALYEKEAFPGDGYEWLGLVDRDTITRRYGW